MSLRPVILCAISLVPLLLAAFGMFINHPGTFFLVEIAFCLVLVSMALLRGGDTRRRILLVAALLACCVSSLAVTFNFIHPLWEERFQSKVETEMYGKHFKAFTALHVFNASDPNVGAAFFKARTYTVVNFWATWCPPCVEETPALNTFNSKQESNGISVIGITWGEDDQLERTRAFISKFQISYPIYVITESEASDVYMANVLPLTLLVDSNGVIMKTVSSKQDTEALLDSLNSSHR